MSLKLWMPLTKDMRNQGLYETNPGANGGIFETGGKLGKCLKTSGAVDTGLPYTEWNYSTDSITMCCWVKFNLAELRTALPSSIVTSSATAPTGNLLGHNSYGGLAIVWATNNVYSSGQVNSISLTGYYRDSSNQMMGTSSYSVPFDTWTHVALVFNKTAKTMQLYINGSVHGGAATVPNTTLVVQSNFKINYQGVWGGNGPSRAIPCRINDVRVYNQALTLQEIKEISKGLVAHWTLDENSLNGPNLITSLISGGNCTVSGNDILVSGTNSDSYFQFNMSEAMVENGLYKISCRGSGFPNGSYYNFPIAAQSNSGPGVLKIQNGYCQLIFVANNTIANAGTRILMDDNGRVAGAGTISDLRLVKLNKSCDISGNHNDLTINGTCSLVDGSKRYSKCINLPEATTLTCANPFAGQTTQQEWSISCWVKASALTNWTSKLNNFNYGNYLKTADNQSILYLNAGTNDYYSYAAGCPQLNTWTHVVFVFRNSDGLRQVWINGVQKASNGPNKTSTPLGMSATIEWFTAYGGDVSDLRLYATALSSSDIQYLYSLGN